MPVWDISPAPFERLVQSIGDIFAIFLLLYLESNPTFLE